MDARLTAARGRAIALALAALCEIADSCSADPVEPSLSLRACLALLYTHSNGERRGYEEFWRAVRRRPRADENMHSLAYLRPTNARTALTVIGRTVGIELTVERWAELRALNSRPSRSPSTNPRHSAPPTDTPDSPRAARG